MASGRVPITQSTVFLFTVMMTYFSCLYSVPRIFERCASIRHFK